MAGHLDILSFQPWVVVRAKLDFSQSSLVCLWAQVKGLKAHHLNLPLVGEVVGWQGIHGLLGRPDEAQMPLTRHVLRSDFRLEDPKFQIGTCGSAEARFRFRSAIGMG